MCGHPPPPAGGGGKIYKIVHTPPHTSHSYFLGGFPKWPKMAKNGPKMAKNGQKWPQKWPKMTPKNFRAFGARRCSEPPPRGGGQINKNGRTGLNPLNSYFLGFGQKWPKMAKNGQKMAKNGQKMVKNGQKKAPKKFFAPSARGGVWSPPPRGGVKSIKSSTHLHPLHTVISEPGSQC